MAEAPLIEFEPARPQGRSLSAVFLLAALFFVWMAYDFHCEGLACEAGPPGSRAFALLSVLTVVSLCLAFFTRNWQGHWACLAVMPKGVRLEVRGSARAAPRLIPFDRIAGLRHVPAYRGKGTLVFDLVPERDGAARGPFVNLPLEGLAGRAQPVFDAIANAMAEAGYRIEDGRFGPSPLAVTRSWRVTRLTA